MKPILFIAFIALGPALADQFGSPATAYAGTDLPVVAAAVASGTPVSQTDEARANDALLCGR